MMPCMHIKLILIMIKTIKFHDLHRKSKFYMEGNMTYEEQKKELYFANTVIGVIDNVKTPMLMYQEEKDVVRKALRMYIDRIENDMSSR